MENPNNDVWLEGDISPRDLAHAVAHSIGNDGEPMRMQFMQALMVDMSVEVDFLEWLVRTRAKPIKLNDMPLRTFEVLAEDFREECGKSESDKKRIIKAFKQSNIETLGIKLLSALPNSEWKRMKSLGYIVDRYADSRIPYRCVILPLKAEADAYKELMGARYWYDLNDLSGDYLDVYYSHADYGNSGFAVANALNFIPKHLTTNVPSVVIWQDDMSKARSVDIHGLDNPAIIEVMKVIVAAIQKGDTFVEIIKGANEMAKELRDRDIPIGTVVNNSVNISGDNNGAAAAGDHARAYATVTNNADAERFEKDIALAIETIRESVEINEQQKNALIDIIAEAKEAVVKNDDERQKESKSKFKYFALGLGNTAVKLLSALSALANLAKFFGIGTP
jgi:hypothetical protein